jgi:hypothetical protein
MKNLVILLSCLLVGNVFSEVPRSVKLAPKNYQVALQSKIEAVVESAIFYSVKFKLFYEDQNCEVLENELKNLSVNGKSESIRFKAFLAGYYLNTPEMLTKIDKINYKDSNLFFQMLADTLQAKILADRSE